MRASRTTRSVGALVAAAMAARALVVLGRQAGVGRRPSQLPPSHSSRDPASSALQPDAPTVTEPPIGIAAIYSTTLPDPLTLTAWATDEGPTMNVPRPSAGRNRGRGRGGSTPPPPLALTWTMQRGPGAVTFDPPKPPIDKADGRATTTATFTVPGEYILRLQANDSTGDGGAGFQCCWTTTHVKVTVKPAVTSKAG